MIQKNVSIESMCFSVPSFFSLRSIKGIKGFKPCSWGSLPWRSPKVRLGSRAGRNTRQIIFRFFMRLESVLLISYLFTSLFRCWYSWLKPPVLVATKSVNSVSSEWRSGKRPLGLSSYRRAGRRQGVTKLSEAHWHCRDLERFGHQTTKRNIYWGSSAGSGQFRSWQVWRLWECCL